MVRFGGLRIFLWLGQLNVLVLLVYVVFIVAVGATRYFSTSESVSSGQVV